MRKKTKPNEDVSNNEKVDTTESISMGFMEADNAREQMLTRMGENLTSDDKLEYLTRLSAEGVTAVLQNYGAIDFYLKYFSELKITQKIIIVEKVDNCLCGGEPDCIICGGKKLYKTQYLKRDIDYADYNDEVRGRLLANYENLVKRYMRLQVSRYGLGREEVLRLLGAIETIKKGIMGMLPFRREDKRQ